MKFVAGIRTTLLLLLVALLSQECDELRLLMSSYPLNQVDSNKNIECRRDVPCILKILTLISQYSARTMWRIYHSGSWIRVGLSLMPHAQKSAKWSDKYNGSGEKHRYFNKYKNKFLAHIYNIYEGIQICAFI